MPSTNTSNSDTGKVSAKSSKFPKKVRRGKRIKNCLTKFKIYYNNARGISSKLDSMTECIHAYKPHLVCITETKLDSEGDVDIQGYKFIPKNNKKGKGGILVGVREDLKHLILEIDRMTEGFEALWIILSNKVTKIRIGCIYAPQECRTGEEVFEAMYKHIQDHVSFLL